MPRMNMTATQFLEILDSLDTNSEGCKIWPFTLNSDGYPKVRVSGFRGAGNRASLGLKLGRPVIKGMLACHTCDIRACVEPSHLYEGTQFDNMRDASERNKLSSGKNHHIVKFPENHRGNKNPRRVAGSGLSLQDMISVKWRLYYRENVRELAKIYSTSTSTIKRMRHSNKVFQHLMTEISVD